LSQKRHLKVWRFSGGLKLSKPGSGWRVFKHGSTPIA
jgi:hypothetical protein